MDQRNVCISEVQFNHGNFGRKLIDHKKYNDKNKKTQRDAWQEKKEHKM